MHRQNSEFHTAFVSHEGSKLLNDDFFGFVEMDDLACYALADGIETGDAAESGKMAVEAVIAAFHAHPSMSKKWIRRYIQSAHDQMSKGREKQSAKASITVVVTDYASLRYGYAGNTRFHVFRADSLYHASKDHSLSQIMADKQEIPMDKIAKHEERGNLSRYLGQKGNLRPQISNKIRLVDGDILALITRGVWENCDSHDLHAALKDAGNDLEKACELTEHLVLSNQSKEIDNYTLAVIFVDKVYVNPNKGKRLKLILKIAIPILAVLVVIGVVFFIQYHRKQTSLRRMETYYINSIESIQDDNFIKADEELGQAFDLAVEVEDERRQNEITTIQRLLDALNNGEAALSKNDFSEAQDYFLRARERSAFTDHLAGNYIEKKLVLISQYISFFDMIELGDNLLTQGNFPLAEERYLAARSLAASIYYSEGKQQALDALETLYEKMGQAAESNENEAKVQAADEIAAADFIAQGDRAVQDGDLIGANLYYTMAKERYASLGNSQALNIIEQKLRLVEQKRGDRQEKLSAAEAYEQKGDAFLADRQYVDAKKQYILARDIYAELRENIRLDAVKSKIEQVDVYLVGSASLNSTTHVSEDFGVPGGSGTSEVMKGG
jgi:serine/threonine protein phosphatase PrpC